MRYTISSALASLLLSGAALAEVPRVVTDIPPVHSLVAQVMGALGSPDLLLERGGDAHSFQLRPSQARGLSEAGLVVWIGPEMTPWLERALEGLGTKGEDLRLAAVEGTHRQEFGATEDHDHGPEAEHDDHDHDHEEAGHDEAGHDGAGHDGHGHVHEGLDPHLWLDPGNAQVWLRAIASELGRLDPEHAADYAANAKAAEARLVALDAELGETLAPAQDRPFVVFHDAYGYFSAHYGLTVAGTVAAGDAAAPGAARLDALRETMAGRQFCIFPEAQHDPKMVQALAQDAGAKVGGVLDPEGRDLEPGPDLYAALLRGMAATITDCVTGGA